MRGAGVEEGAQILQRPEISWARGVVEHPEQVEEDDGKKDQGAGDRQGRDADASELGSVGAQARQGTWDWFVVTAADVRRIAGVRGFRLENGDDATSDRLLAILRRPINWLPRNRL